MDTEITDFRVTVLSERAVKTLFKKCLAKDTTQAFEEARIFTKAFGYPDNQDPIIFDKQKLLENKMLIHFLFGQLKSFHNTEDPNLHFEDIIFTYLDKPWTTDKDVIFQFLHLGATPSVEAITPLLYPTHDSVKNKSLVPTRIPVDPEYDSWVIGYKKILEKKKSGQEPADD